MDKLNMWLLGVLMLLNLILATVLVVLAVSNPFRNATQENTIQALAQLSSELQDGKKVLSPSEQARLVNDFRFVAKTQAEAQAAGAKMIWAIVEVIAISLVFQTIILFRMLRNRSGVAPKKVAA